MGYPVPIWSYNDSNITKCMTAEGNSALFSTNFDRQTQLQRGLMNFQL